MVAGMLLAFAGTVGALETMAYRFAVKPWFPVEMDPFSAEELPEPRVLKESPEPTCFVEAGDRLEDVTEVLRKNGAPLKGGWAVWNETRRLVVVRGARVDHWRVPVILYFKKQPVEVAVTYEWFPAAGKLESIPPGREALALLSVASRSGQKAGAEITVLEGEGAGSYRVESEAVLSYSRSLIDVNCRPEWSAMRDGEAQQWKLEGSCVLRDGVRRLLGGCAVADAGTGWIVAIQADACLTDGMPWREARMREENGRAVAAPPNALSRSDGGEIVPLEGGWFLSDYPVAPEFAESYGPGEDADDSIDPFLPQLPEQPKAPPGFVPSEPEVVIPLHLEGLVALPLVDMRELLRDKGVPLKEGDCVLLDPLGHRLVVCSRNRDVVELVGVLFSGIGCGIARNIRSDLWLEVGEREIGRAFVLSRSGLTTSFEWLVGAGEKRLSATTEATFGVSDFLIDVRSVFEMQPHGDELGLGPWKRSVVLTLPEGRERLDEVGRVKGLGGLRAGIKLQRLSVYEDAE